MIKANIAFNSWLQIVIAKDNASDEIRTFQARASSKDLDDLIICLTKTIDRVKLISDLYHEEDFASEAYNNADVVKTGSFVTITNNLIGRVQLVYMSSSLYFYISDLVPLLKEILKLKTS